ncbi:MAG: hypothetical protein IT376_05250 [Polyangiaceae bacterium]|nr:hypothetical protein [Polyangiaceae bacterium]
MRPFRPLASLAALAVVAAPSLALAEVERAEHHQDGSIYKFRDDLMSSPSTQPQAATIRVLGRGYRSNLLRPRTHWVSRLFASVEHL